MDSMRLQFLKYPDAPHWRHEDLSVLGEDEHGLWLGSPVGAEHQKGLDGEVRYGKHEWVFCVQRDRWWTMVFNGDEGDSIDFTHFVDIITPPVFTGNTIEMVDLDLDVVRRRNGEVFIDDEDEFAEHQVLLGYPDWMIDKARTVTAQASLAVEANAEPFNATCRAWYAKFTGSA